MDANFTCGEEDCISEASAFYFKTKKQRLVCDAHRPAHGVKLYPIEQIDFIESPEDKTEFLRRQRKVRRSKASLQEVLSLAKHEKTAALALLEEKKARAVQVISQVYEAKRRVFLCYRHFALRVKHMLLLVFLPEKRRTKQHFRQVEVFINDFTLELDQYLCKKENRLSSPLKKIKINLTGLSLLQVRTLENDLELARVVMDSCSRGKLALDSHLDVLLDPKRRIHLAEQLFQLAKESSKTKSYIELQQALANCEESAALNPLKKVTELKFSLEYRLEDMKTERESDFRDLLMRDPESVRSLLDVHTRKIDIQKDEGGVIQVERLYQKALSFALPMSQSDATLSILLDYAEWCTEQGREKTSELKKVWKAALAILNKHYPNSEDAIQGLLQLGRLYQQEGNYRAAIRRCQSALDILKASSSDRNQRATDFANLGMLYEEMERFVEAKSCYKRSVDILKSYPPNSRQLAETLIQLGGFYSRRGDTWKAEIHMQEAYEISSSKNFQDLLEQLLAKGYKPPTEVCILTMASGEVTSLSTRLRILWATKRSPLHRRLSFNVTREICSYIGDVQKLIAMLENKVMYFDVATSQWQQLMELDQNIDVDIYTFSTFIYPNRVLVCGGGKKPCTCHVGNRAYMLEGDGSVQELPHMSTGRKCHGAVWDSDRQALYVFGGECGHGTCYTDSLRSSEIFLSMWSPLPDMHHARRKFSPCWHSSIVYLCGGWDTDSVETYNPRSNTFDLLDFTLPEMDSTIAVVKNGTITVISENYISKLKRGRLTKHERRSIPVKSSCTPLVYGESVYIHFDKYTQCINLTTGATQYNCILI